MRKRRTRQHQIEDLSQNFVEKQALLAFCTFISYPSRHYSYDAIIETFNVDGEQENGEIFVQVKATDHLNYSQKNNAYEIELEKRDLELWLDQPFPILIVLYDAMGDCGYFVDLKKYFKENKLALESIQKFKTVFIPASNRFDADVAGMYRKIKNGIYEKIKGI